MSDQTGVRHWLCLGIDDIEPHCFHWQPGSCMQEPSSTGRVTDAINVISVTGIPQVLFCFHRRGHYEGVAFLVLAESDSLDVPTSFALKILCIDRTTQQYPLQERCMYKNKSHRDSFRASEVNGIHGIAPNLRHPVKLTQQLVND